MHAAGSMAASHSAEHTGNKGECVFLKMYLDYFVGFLFIYCNKVHKVYDCVKETRRLIALVGNKKRE